MKIRTLRLLLLALVVGVIGMIAAPASQADRGAQLMIEDPTVAPGNPANTGGINPSPLGRLPFFRQNLGARFLRIQAFWNAVSPGERSRTIPPGFNPANPNDPQYNWADLDRAVRQAASSGLNIMMTINNFNPAWASTEPGRGQPGWKPSPLRYAQFATALAQRYGRFVNYYAFANETNEGFNLQPQTECSRQRVGRRFRFVCERLAAYIYRKLIIAAYPVIKRNDPGAKVIIGEIAPIGGIGPRAGNLAPLAFIRALGCLDDRYRRITYGGCRGFRPAPSDGIFGYHAYQVRQRPQQRTRNPNSAKLGDLQRLFGVIDRVHRMRRLRTPGNRRFVLWLDEYGYETCPPDCRNGVSESQQSRFLQESAYVAWRTPRVKMFNQYLFVDDGTNVGFQTGLRFNPLVNNGRDKISLGTFPHPFFIDTRRGRNRAVIWGQVRPGPFTTVQVFRNGALYLTARTDRLGYFSRVRRLARGARLFFRYSLRGQTFTSDTVRVP